jgi:hypothetical protein
MFTESLTAQQRQKYYDWRANRPPRSDGVSGGRYTWMYTPTTLGTVIKVVDNCTEEEIDLSDYERW